MLTCLLDFDFINILNLSRDFLILFTKKKKKGYTSITTTHYIYRSNLLQKLVSKDTFSIYIL